ncbi:MAG: GNAT family N-acetyltransferase [Deltaproteobacteria bacterium]|nr:GNAT family N-acetyltransferase [Deltaproteobacteria bacterium]
MNVASIIRRAEQRDLHALIQLIQKCIQRMRENGIDQWDEIYPDKTLLEKDIQSRTIYVCESGGQLSGCVTLNDVQDPAYASIDWGLEEPPIGIIHRLMVSPDFQGRGLGRALMSHIEKEAMHQGIRTIRLDAFTGNPAALAVYEKIGYKRAGIVQFRKGPFWCFEKRVGHV